MYYILICYPIFFSNCNEVQIAKSKMVKLTRREKVDMVDTDVDVG
jgi:hypothetical protein